MRGEENGRGLGAEKSQDGRGWGGERRQGARRRRMEPWCDISTGIERWGGPGGKALNKRKRRKSSGVSTMLFLLPLHNVSQKSSGIPRPRNFRLSPLRFLALPSFRLCPPRYKWTPTTSNSIETRQSTRGGASFIRVATRVIFPGNASVGYANGV